MLFGVTKRPATFLNELLPATAGGSREGLAQSTGSRWVGTCPAERTLGPPQLRDARALSAVSSVEPGAARGTPRGPVLLSGSGARPASESAGQTRGSSGEGRWSWQML